MAYLRWGPLFHKRGESLDFEVATCLARALENEYVSKRGLLLRILPNAFVGSRRAALFQSVFRGFTAEPLTSANTYRTFILGLDPPLETALADPHERLETKAAAAEIARIKESRTKDPTARCTSAGVDTQADTEQACTRL